MHLVDGATDTLANLPALLYFPSMCWTAKRMYNDNTHFTVCLCHSISSL